MKIETLVVGQLATNCYLVWEEKNKQTLIIDPGDSADYLSDKILGLGLKPKAIIATHGHFDHVLAALELKLAFKIPFLINKKDTFILKYLAKSAKFWLNLKNEPANPPPEIDQNPKDGTRIKLGKNILKVLATPGHTPGGISLYSPSQGLLFSGDTLFANGWGRTDLPGGSEKELLKSLKKLFKLPGKTRVFPGHGPETTIETEKETLKTFQDLKTSVY
jgi:hydroxyacylglutathione hydrolase